MQSRIFIPMPPYNSRMRILVVEDERRVASIVIRALRENEYEVDHAETGEKALEIASRNSYDCVLLDVRLPGLSGIQVCRQLRAAGSDTPILMLTARTLVEHRVEGLDAGADDYLTKPFAVAELLARVRALIRRRIGGRVLRYADLEIGSYPYFRRGDFGVTLVLRGIDKRRLAEATEELIALIRSLGGDPQEGLSED